MIIKRRAFFSLLEVLIAMSLVMLIISFLTYSFYQVSILNSAAEELEKQAFDRRYLQSRLMETITRTTKFSEKEKETYFFSSSASSSFAMPGTESLCFTFDNGVNVVDANFSNKVLGRLFIDPKGRLSLAIMPSVSKWEKDKLPLITREILMENVLQLHFSFFVPAEKNGEKQEVTPGFLSTWKQEFQKLPAVVKIDIIYLEKQLQKQVTMMFPLPNTNYKITY